MIRRISGALGIAREGAGMALAVLIVGAILMIAGVHLLGVLVIIAGIAIGAFFRDPNRFPARTTGVVISGADGKVTDISDAPIPGASGPAYRRVAVFMSPLDVHVNRAPVAGTVIRVEHTAGEFRAAFHDEANQYNERTLTVFADARGRQFGMMQIAGYLARRIICTLRIHDKIEVGQRVGLIMFGSRVDHYFPLEFRVTVAIGDRVRAGESVIAEELIAENPSA